MTELRLLSTSSRTASLLIAPKGARFTLPSPISWSLKDGAGAALQSGMAVTAALFLDRLQPDTAYCLETETGSLQFCTKICAGRVDATDFGVSADGADNSAAFQRAIAATPKGGTLHLPAGRYLTRPIFLKPQMTLHLAAGAELTAVPHRKGWPQLPARDVVGAPLGTWEGLPEPCFAAVLSAINCPDLTITGAGVIDGGGDAADWWTWPKETREGARRPRTVHLINCPDATLSGVTVRNSPSWTVHPYRCDRLHVSNLKIQNPADSPNTDGLNPESCIGVEITGTRFSVGDDCIAIKAGKRGPGANDHLSPCRDLTISHCRMEFGHGAVVLGSEMSGGIFDVDISACEFHDTDRGLRLKTRRGRGGVIDGVRLRDVAMWGVQTPIAANAFYFCDPDGKDDWVQSRRAAVVDDTTPILRNIRVQNVTAEHAALAGMALLGLPESPIQGVEVDHFEVSFDPEAQADVPLMTLGMEKMRHVDVLAEFAQVRGHVTKIDSKGSLLTC